jgi:hypothetical protein
MLCCKVGTYSYYGTFEQVWSYYFLIRAATKKITAEHRTAPHRTAPHRTQLTAGYFLVATQIRKLDDQNNNSVFLLW